MLGIPLWSVFSVVVGLLLIVVSVTADAMGGPDWWHIGTGMGAGMAVYGVMTAVLRRRRAHSK